MVAQIAAEEESSLYLAKQIGVVWVGLDNYRGSFSSAVVDEYVDLERKKRRQRQRIFDVEDEIMEKRDSLINALERRMQQRTESIPLFTIRWTVR